MRSRASVMQIVRLGLSLCLFGFVLSQIDWRGVQTLLYGIDYIWLAVHVMVLLLERVVFTYKWHILLVVKNVVLPLWSLLVITLIGKFWGLFLPSSIGVDVVRGYYLYRKIASGAIAASSVLIDKVLALWALLLMGSFGLLFYGAVLEGLKIGVYLAAVLLITGALLYSLQRDELVMFLEKHLPRLLGSILSQKVLNVYHSFLEYKQFRSTVWLSFALSIVLQLVRVLGVYTMALALDIQIPAIYYFVLIPVSMILIMLPISIGGFGLREGIFVALFALAGMSTTDAFALGFALSITDLFVSLLGGVVYVIERPAVARDGER